MSVFFFFQAEDGIRDYKVTGVQTCALPIWIWGDEPWQAEGTPAKDAEQTGFSATGKFTSNLEFADREKKKAFVESITSGNFHNQADKGAESALSCMMARTAAYTGRGSAGRRR